MTGLLAGIGMMAAPGQGRALVDDLDELRRLHGADLLVSLVGEHELDYLGIPDLVERAGERGLVVLRWPIGDFSVPSDVATLKEPVDRILDTAARGRAAIVHCWAGRGRTGLVAAACLVKRGFAPAEAIAAVRRCRPGTIENSDQEEAVADFARALGRST
ncbi:phosphatase domain-containing putative toxin [Sorangium sp. So ce1335]|uniref:phosphatase domain-containing putative toxin n=1 Tax=Sorangium sp. So ce1335 TaxID=3133335 RepID=UPI003F60F5DF